MPRPLLIIRPSPRLSRLLHLRARAACVIGSAMVGVTALLVLVAALSGQPSSAELRQIGETAQATVVLDRHDAPAFTIFREQRIDVPLSEVSVHFIQALLSIEDRRFLEHRGIDFVRVGGAAVNNLRQGRVAQGASTITQQLARQAFLTNERTFTRKLKEAVLAVRLERFFSKQEILEFYLNRVYFGAGLYGVQTASMGYFGKPAADLNLSEAALLAGLVKAPSAYAPTVAPARALARRDLVLRVMRDTGVIDEATREIATETILDLTNGLSAADVQAGHFREAVRQELAALVDQDALYEGGLRVFTTLDVAMQRAAEQEVAKALETIYGGGEPSGSSDADRLQAALVALDPRTGEVRALVGGRDAADTGFNRATQARRQPGSAFKPFIYAAALERGFSPATIIGDLDAPIATFQGDWIPADGEDGDPSMTLRTALSTSSNRAAVQLLQRVGVHNAVEDAGRLGMGHLPEVPSLALGSGEVTLMAMTRAFAAFADHGILRLPTLIRRVESADGRVLYRHVATPEQGISSESAFLLTSMMADVLDVGTARSARQVGFVKPAAGKTGTTNDYYDAWFVGYTPFLATGVWLGYDQPRPIAANGYASQLAVPLWARFMMKATVDDPDHGFAPPPGIVPVRICRLSGARANHECDSVEVFDADGHRHHESLVYTEYFTAGPCRRPIVPITAIAAGGNGSSERIARTGRGRHLLPLHRRRLASVRRK